MSGALSVASILQRPHARVEQRQRQQHGGARMPSPTRATLLFNTATNTGVNAGSTAIGDQGNLYSMASNAGAGEQAANQANLTNEQQQYQAQTQDPYNSLSGLMSIIGSQNWGGSTTGNTTTTTTPSAWQVIGGLLGAGGSAAGTAGSLGWKPFA